MPVSLDVSPELLTQAETGEVDPAAFLEAVRTSLPYAYNLIDQLTTELKTGDREFADNLTPPDTETERGQLLRALASDAIRGSLENHFGVCLAFQNCHRVAVFQPGTEDGGTYRRFTSQRAQILNQSPTLRDC